MAIVRHNKLYNQIQIVLPYYCMVTATKLMPNPKPNPTPSIQSFSLEKQGKTNRMSISIGEIEKMRGKRGK